MKKLITFYGAEITERGQEFLDNLTDIQVKALINQINKQIEIYGVNVEIIEVDNCLIHCSICDGKYIIVHINDVEIINN